MRWCPAQCAVFTLVPTSRAMVQVNSYIRCAVYVGVCGSLCVRLSRTVCGVRFTVRCGRNANLPY